MIDIKSIFCKRSCSRMRVEAYPIPSGARMSCCLNIVPLLFEFGMALFSQNFINKIVKRYCCFESFSWCLGVYAISVSVTSHYHQIVTVSPFRNYHQFIFVDPVQVLTIATYHMVLSCLGYLSLTHEYFISSTHGRH